MVSPERKAELRKAANEHPMALPEHFAEALDALDASDARVAVLEAALRDIETGDTHHRLADAEQCDNCDLDVKIAREALEMAQGDESTKR